MPSKQQVIALHQNDPTMTSKQIAVAILGASAEDFRRLTSTDGWVRRTAQRNGITLARASSRPKKPKVYRDPRPDGLLTLGLACRKAGLTVADINDIGATIASI